MKEVKLYCCEKCGVTYETPDEAIRCESMHHWPEKVLECLYDHGKSIPVVINVRFDNGEVRTYTLGKKGCGLNERQ